MAKHYHKRIHPFLYVISSLEPKCYWGIMKNELSTYEYYNMGKMQVRAYSATLEHIERFSNFVTFVSY